MKILYMVDYYQPKVGYNEYFLPREWSRMGHEVKILSSNYYYPFPNYDATAGKLLGPRRHKAGSYMQEKIEVIKKPLKFEIFTRAIFFGHEDIIREFRPDIVIVNKSSSFNSTVAAMLKKKYGFKLIAYDAHLMSGYMAVGNVKFKNFIYWLYRKTVSNYMNKRIDKYIAVQEGSVDVMENLYGQHPVQHIPLGTDPERFYFDKNKRKSVRKELGIPPNSQVAIYTGKVIPTKGVDILFQAFGYLSSSFPNLHLLIVGAGTKEYLDKCMGHVKLEHHPRIHFVGFKSNEELYQYYSAADFGVWPLEESTSMNDAAACNLAFIANDQVGLKLRFKNNNALQYKRGDFRDLAKKISQLVLNPKETKLMGKRGRELVEKELSWQQIAKSYLHFIPEDLEKNLAKTISWLKRAQDATSDGGVSAYYSLVSGWAPSFIETTGYIISTFLKYWEHTGHKEYLNRAIKMGDFLLKMQLPSGGFRTYTPEKVPNSPPTIFNTGQDIIGLADLYQATKSNKYLSSAINASEYLISVQQKNGTWLEFVSYGSPKTYHARVAYALLKIYKLTNDPKYKNSAIKQLDWVISKQKKNNFISSAELPVTKYPNTLTHTLAYVAEGLLYSSQILENNKYHNAAVKLIKKVNHYFDRHNKLPSYFDVNWREHENFRCPTGEIQFASLILELYKLSSDKNFLDNAFRLIKSVEQIQGNTGGVPGCWPIYGDIFNNRGYCRLSYINWAAKYLADAQMKLISLW